MAPPKRTIHYHVGEDKINKEALGISDFIGNLKAENRYLGFVAESATFETAAGNTCTMVCVIGIATATEIHLFDVRNFRSLPKQLHNLLTAEDITLVTYYRHKQMQNMDNSFFGSCNAALVSCVDLRHTFKLFDAKKFQPNPYLQELVAEFCGYQIPYPGVCMDNINKRQLNNEQQEYLAGVAGGCYDLCRYYKTKHETPTLASTPSTHAPTITPIPPTKTPQTTKEEKLPNIVAALPESILVAVKWMCEQNPMPTATDKDLLLILGQYPVWKFVSTRDFVVIAQETIKQYRSTTKTPHSDRTSTNIAQIEAVVTNCFLNNHCVKTDEEWSLFLRSKYAPWQSVSTGTINFLVAEALKHHKEMCMVCNQQPPNPQTTQTQVTIQIKLPENPVDQKAELAKKLREAMVNKPMTPEQIVEFVSTSQNSQV